MLKTNSISDLYKIPIKFEIMDPRVSEWGFAGKFKSKIVGISRLWRIAVLDSRGNWNWIALQLEKWFPALREKVCVESTSFFSRPD